MNFIEQLHTLDPICSGYGAYHSDFTTEYSQTLDSLNMLSPISSIFYEDSIADITVRHDLKTQSY